MMKTTAPTEQAIPADILTVTTLLLRESDVTATDCVPSAAAPVVVVPAELCAVNPPFRSRATMV